MKRPKKPKEDPSVGVLRQRQFADRAELDEEENRRIKTALHPRKRAFRRQSGRSGDSNSSERSTSGNTGERATARAFDFKR